MSRFELLLLAMIAVFALLACGKKNATATGACAASANSTACSTCCTTNGANGYSWSSGTCTCRGGQ